jgi:hypothetical protein
MADPGSDHEQNSSSSNGPASDTDLTTDGATLPFCVCFKRAL